MTMQDYRDLAFDYEYIGSLLVQANARADTLGLTVPSTVADVLTFPTKVREVGARRAGTWVDPPTERHDEPEEGP